MPLPDERPRGSVANLIGRFEQQGKRPQPHPPPPQLPLSRPSIVVPQATGSSAKKGEEKEKPEVSVEADDKPPAASLTPSCTTQTPSPSPQSGPPIPIISESPRDRSPTPQVSEVPVSVPFVQDDAEPPKPPSESTSPSVPPEPLPVPLEPLPVSLELLPVSLEPLPVSPETTPISPEPLSVSPEPLSVPPEPLPVLKTTKAPKLSLPKSIGPAKKPAKRTQQHQQHQQQLPLRAQHTGTSVTSTTSRRPVARASLSTPPRSTPSHSQKPARSQTPSSAPKPKTPPSASSSNLFAPTAASLAKARNAPQDPPVPVRRATLSSAAAARLSQPTAASASKARAPVAIASAPRGSKPGPSKASAAPVASAKPRTSSAGKAKAAGDKAKRDAHVTVAGKITSDVALGDAVASKSEDDGRRENGQNGHREDLSHDGDAHDQAQVPSAEENDDGMEAESHAVVGQTGKELVLGDLADMVRHLEPPSVKKFIIDAVVAEIPDEEDT